jgi:hypothetical protein
MNRSSIISLIIFLFGLNLLIGDSGVPERGEETLQKAQGVVLDRSGRRIGFARIVVTPLTDASADPKNANKADRRVVCSNSMGNWRVGLPDYSHFVFKAYSNGYETLEKQISLVAGVRSNTGIELILNQGLAHILWGSMEHIQLYVPPLHQKNIEHRIRSGYLKSLENYIRSNIGSDGKKHVCLLAGHLLFENHRPKESKLYFERAGSGLWFNLMGNDKMKKGRYGEALGDIEDKEDITYMLTYSPRNTETVGRIRVEVADSKFKILYDDRMRADYIQAYLKKKKREIPDIQILNTRFENKTLSLDVKDYVMTARENETRKGRVFIEIEIMDSKNRSLIIRKRLLSPTNPFLTWPFVSPGYKRDGTILLSRLRIF